ncbi:MAG: hypothetical protein PGN34_26000 [Methylobacterium frigidaeris]
MRVHLLICLCVGVAGAAGYLLFPSTEEQLSMLARDGRSSEAASRLTELLALARRDPALMAAAARVHERSGRFKRAAELLELYVEARPEDTPALDWLADVHRAANDPAGATRALVRAIGIAPTRARLSALLDLYRGQERIDEERALLKETTDPALLRPVDVERLGILLSWAGERDAALISLRRADELLPPSGEVGRVVLADLLLNAGLRDEAAERAERWVDGWHDKPWLGVHVTRLMAKKGDAARAVALGIRVAGRHPDTRFYLARVIAEDGNRGVAGAILENWATEGPEPTRDQIAQYVEAAGIVGDVAAVWRKVALIFGEPAWSDAQVAVAEALVQRHGFGILAPIRQRLSWASLRARPLFAARLALHDGNPTLAGSLLAGVTPASLDPASQLEWASLLTVTLGARQALSVLSGFGRRRLLPANLIPYQARLAESLGDAPEQVRAMNELRRMAQAGGGGTR